ncbi:MAG: hypothetical protein HDR28_11710 [Lachnospiraceae bacterium]|nr:hypothetical protein [Lachnospiraceae bacterium]
MRRILCMFLVWIMVFTEMDFTVMAAEAGNVSEIGTEISETVETAEQEITDRQDSDMADKEEISDETGEETSDETGIKESEKTDEQDKTEKEEGAEIEDAEEKSEASNEEEEKEEDLELGDRQEEIDAEESVELDEVELPEDENSQEENITQFGSDEIEVYAARSSDSVNSAVSERIYSFKSKYPEGSTFGKFEDNDGYSQCYGFALQIAKDVFGKYPSPSILRSAANGTVSNGWTCYYVTASNCNSLSVEPGDLIDNGSHSAMALSVTSGNIICVQCNWGGTSLVYWTHKFNYNSKNATLSGIYNSRKGTVRLWKPSESLKNAIVGSTPVADTEAPRVGAVTVSNNNTGTGVVIGAMMDFACTATDNVGVTKAWAVVTGQNTSKRFEASVSGNHISGQWSTHGFDARETISMIVYAQDAAGNTGSSSLTIALGEKAGVTPEELILEVGEKGKVNAWINTLYKYDPEKQRFSTAYGGQEAASISYEGLCAEIIGLKPGSCRFTFDYNISSDTTLMVGDDFFNVFVIPQTPVLVSITNTAYKYDYLEYTPVEHAATYDLYRLREGIDTEYQLVGNYEKNETNSMRVEHPADGSTYYYKITAKSVQTDDYTKYPAEPYYPTSHFSNILISTMASFTPANLTAVSNRDNEIDLTWEAVVDAYGYEIYRSTEETNKELIAVCDAPMTSYTDGDVDGGITYDYDVYAVDVVGEKGMEATVSCTAKGVREEKVYYTVSFQTGFIDILMEDEKIEKGKCSLSLALSEERMQMDGYEFIGWYTKPGGTGERYTSETQIMSDMVLYAFWKEKEEQKSGKFWVVPIGDQKYTGKAIKPAVQVYDGNTLLVQGTDYTVSYKNNVKVCDAESVEISKAPSVIVKGRKNYSDRETIPFSIVAVDLNGSGITAENMIAAYTGRELKPVPVLYYNGKKLKYKTDYTVIYPQSLRNVGQYSIEVVGRGGYTGSRIISYTITDKLLLSKATVSKIPNQIYSGKLQRPALTVKYGNSILREDIAQEGNGDYTVRYINNRNIGTATVILTAVEGSAYMGSKTMTFKITGTPINKVSVASIGNCVYNGNAIRPQVNLTVKTKSGSSEPEKLREGIDYTLSYSKNINVGTGKISITGKGKYTGSRTVTFRIIPYDLSKLPAKSISDSQQIGYYISVNSGEPVAYQKGKTQPSVTVSYSDYVEDDDEPFLMTHILAENDYKVVYKNANAVSSQNSSRPQIIISGKGNYKGTITSDSAKFEIVKADLSTVEAKATDVSYRAKEGNFTGTKVVLYDTNGKKLTVGTDYNKKFTYYNVTDYIVSEYGMNLQTAASCELNIRDRSDFEAEIEKAESGTSQKIIKLDIKNDISSAYQIICVRISASSAVKCNYTGTAYALYRIATSDIGNCSVKVNGLFTYNGTELTINKDDLVVTMGSGANRRELVYGRDYLIDDEGYTNNVKVGTAKVSIYGIGKYCGTRKISFRIRAKKFSFFH